MTDEQLRVAIAEACGWTYMRRKLKQGEPHGYNLHCVWLFPPGWKQGDPAPVGEFEPSPKMRSARGAVPLPDYFKDLNAMAQAEATLTPDQCFLYERLLLRNVEGVSMAEGPCARIWHSDSRTRALAFVRCLSEPLTVGQG